MKPSSGDTSRVGACRWNVNSANETRWGWAHRKPLSSGTPVGQRQRLGGARGFGGCPDGFGDRLEPLAQLVVGGLQVAVEGADREVPGDPHRFLDAHVPDQVRRRGAPEIVRAEARHPLLGLPVPVRESRLDRQRGPDVPDLAERGPVAMEQPRSLRGAGGEARLGEATHRSFERNNPWLAMLL